MTEDTKDKKRNQRQSKPTGPPTCEQTTLLREVVGRREKNIISVYKPRTKQKPNLSAACLADIRPYDYAATENTINDEATKNFTLFELRKVTKRIIDKQLIS